MLPIQDRTHCVRNTSHATHQDWHEERDDDKQHQSMDSPREEDPRPGPVASVRGESIRRELLHGVIAWIDCNLAGKQRCRTLLDTILGNYGRGVARRQRGMNLGSLRVHREAMWEERFC